MNMAETVTIPIQFSDDNSVIYFSLTGYSAKCQIISFIFSPDNNHPANNRQKKVILKPEVVDITFKAVKEKI